MSADHKRKRSTSDENTDARSNKVAAGKTDSVNSETHESDDDGDDNDYINSLGFPEAMIKELQAAETEASSANTSQIVYVVLSQAEGEHNSGCDVLGTYSNVKKANRKIMESFDTEYSMVMEGGKFVKGCDNSFYGDDAGAWCITKDGTLKLKAYCEGEEGEIYALKQKVQ